MISSTLVFKSFTMMCLGWLLFYNSVSQTSDFTAFAIKVLRRTPFKHCFCAILSSSKTPTTYIRLFHFHFSQFFYPSASPRWVFSSELPSKFTTSLFQCFYNLLVNLFIPVKEFFQFNSSFTVPISLPYFSNLSFVSFYILSIALIKSKSDNSNT